MGISVSKKWMSNKAGTRFLKVTGEPMIGKGYHVYWAHSNGVLGRCVSIDRENKTVSLKAPRSGFMFKEPVKWEDLRHTRKQQFRIENGRNPYRWDKALV